LPKDGLPSALHAPLAGALTWWLPGLGHIYLGQRTRGLVLMVTITATFWSGIAIGGVRDTVDPDKRKLWFVAQLCSGGNTVAAYVLNLGVTSYSARTGAPVRPSHWMSADVGVHYTGIAGLLNLLVIFDVVGRVDSGPSHRRAKRPLRPESS